LGGACLVKVGRRA
jgi:hypothetical protein